MNENLSLLLNPISSATHCEPGTITMILKKIIACPTARQRNQLSNTLWSETRDWLISIAKQKIHQIHKKPWMLTVEDLEEIAGDAFVRFINRITDKDPTKEVNMESKANFIKLFTRICHFLALRKWDSDSIFPGPLPTSHSGVGDADDSWDQSKEAHHEQIFFNLKNALLDNLGKDPIDREIVELRLQGYNWQEITQELGHRHPHMRFYHSSIKARRQRIENSLCEILGKPPEEGT